LSQDIQLLIDLPCLKEQCKGTGTVLPIYRIATSNDAGPLTILVVYDPQTFYWLSEGEYELV